MFSFRTHSPVALLIALAVVAAPGCEPTPKPVTTGVPKTYEGLDPSGEPLPVEGADADMPRPSLPRTTANRATLPDGSRVAVQYQSPSLDRPISQVSDQELAAEALARIGPPAVPSLVQALQHDDPLVRREAVHVLMRMGPDAKSAAPELTRLLDDEDELVRKYAAKALGNIGPDAAVAVPALMLDLLQPTPDVPGQSPPR